MPPRTPPASAVSARDLAAAPRSLSKRQTSAAPAHLLPAARVSCRRHREGKAPAAARPATAHVHDPTPGLGPPAYCLLAELEMRGQFLDRQHLSPGRM